MISESFIHSTCPGIHGNGRVPFLAAETEDLEASVALGGSTPPNESWKWISVRMIEYQTGGAIHFHDFFRECNIRRTNTFLERMRGPLSMLVHHNPQCHSLPRHSATAPLGSRSGRNPSPNRTEPNPVLLRNRRVLARRLRVSDGWGGCCMVARA